LAGFLIIAGIINIKDFFWYGKGISLQVPHKTRFLLTRFVQKGTVPATIILGILVTLFELPCSLPLYVGSVALMYQYLGVGKAILYLGIYNLMFVLPLLVVLTLILSGRRVFELKEWQEANERRMKLMMGLTLVVMSIVLILFI
jgi:cytochrome c biogenesis protein CcdA